MKKIRFKKLSIQNFLSVGNDPVEIEFLNGITPVEGINRDSPDRRNGTGKTTIFQAHYFALFGETINKIKSDHVVNNVTKGKGLVVSEFDVEEQGKVDSYVIKRQVKPSKVELWRNGEDITRDSIANTNKFIHKLLSTNPTAYKCCDLLTVRDTDVFMDMSSEDKRKFIEDVFNINIFSLMAKELKSMISENNYGLTSSKTKLTSQQSHQKTLEELRDKMMAQLEEQTSKKQEKVDDLNEKIRKCGEVFDTVLGPMKEKMKNLQDELSGKEEKDVKLNQAIKSKVDRYHNLVEEIKTLQQKLDYENSHKDSCVCDKCNQPLPPTQIEKREETIKELEESLRRNQQELQSVEEMKDRLLNAWSKFDDEIENLSGEIEKLKREESSLRIQTLNSKNLYKEQLEELEKDQVDSSILDNTNQELENSRKSLDEVEEEIKEFQKKAGVYNTCKFVLSDEGAKSFVVKKLLKLLNDTIEHYLIKFGLGVRCKFDEYFDEVVTNSKGKVFSYKNASGAEKKSLDVACVFAFSEMRKKIAQVQTNLLFIDEAFDNSLDAKGLELIMEEVKSKVDEENLGVYVISHRPDMRKCATNEPILIEKVNDISKIVS